MKSAVWVGLDWDYVTGDCRQLPWSLSTAHCCAQACAYCGLTVGRGPRHKLTQAQEQARLNRVVTLVMALVVTRVVVRDSHAALYPLLHRGDTVFHLDAHEDLEDKWGELNCGSWRGRAERRGVHTYQVEPQEVGPQAAELGLLGSEGQLTAGLFICLSSPYTHPRRDADLLALLWYLRQPVDFNLGAVKL
jgi:hypothetical protein